MEINIFIINRMTEAYKESLEESGLFSPDQRECLINAFRCGIEVLYYGIPDDY